MLVCFAVLSLMLVRVMMGIGTSIRSLAEEMTNSAHEVMSASQQVSSSAQELSRGAQSQAAAVEETAAAMEEIAATARQNADHASRCAALMTSTRLCGAMLVAMPTAIPVAPFTSRFGYAAGRTVGSVSWPS